MVCLIVGLNDEIRRSLEHLERFARKQSDHRQSWSQFMRKLHMTGAVGVCVPILLLRTVLASATASIYCVWRSQVWHEAYVVQPGSYDCVYSDMPPHLLGAVPTHGVHTTLKAGPSPVEVVVAGDKLATSSSRMKASADYK
jgi:hypothetical protein